jgi:hypothetical protein
MTQPMTPVEMLPCPFCGCQPLSAEQVDEVTHPSNDCPAISGLWFTKDAWNTRASDATIASMREALAEQTDIVGETLDKDFGFWSSVTMTDRRLRLYSAWKKARAALNPNKESKGD